MLARIAGDGVRAIVVETAQRFARDLMVQEIGFVMLPQSRNHVDNGRQSSVFLDDGPTSKLIRQILGAVAEFDKAMAVAELKAPVMRQPLSTRVCPRGQQKVGKNRVR
jgi:hypothetical protein